MPVRNPSARAATFDLVSYHNMLAKLAREIERIANTTDREDVSDHGTNAALTAWHLADWFWADIRGDWEIRTALAKEFNTDVKSFDRDELKRQVAKNCRGLEICQIIATASKHVGWSSEKDNSGFTATGSARSSTTNGESETDYHVETRWILKVVIDEEKLEALPIFREVFAYWQQLINKHGIGRTKSSLEPPKK
jgi:hypothetical protein